ncbi:MAG: trimethylamine methyltransferase family protein, partial [Candidatus Thorarchaeota archaeon]
MLKISILSPQQQDSIHAAALNVLKTTGCEIQDKKWLEVLAQGGVKVDFTTSRAFVTDEDIVNSALNSCGRSIKYLARDPKKDRIIGQGTAKTHTPEGTITVIDLHTRIRRQACLSDLADLTKICDYLPNVDAVVDPVIPYDIHPSFQGLMALRTMIENSSKPVDPAGLAMGKGFPFVLQMLFALLGDRDKAEYSMGIGVTATSPLRFPFNQLDFFWQGIELGT